MNYLELSSKVVGNKMEYNDDFNSSFFNGLVNEKN